MQAACLDLFLMRLFLGIPRFYTVNVYKLRHSCHYAGRFILSAVPLMPLVFEDGFPKIVINGHDSVKHHTLQAVDISQILCGNMQCGAVFRMSDNKNKFYCQFICLKLVRCVSVSNCDKLKFLDMAASQPYNCA